MPHHTHLPGDPDPLYGSDTLFEPDTFFDPNYNPTLPSHRPLAKAPSVISSPGLPRVVTVGNAGLATNDTAKFVASILAVSDAAGALSIIDRRSRAVAGDVRSMQTIDALKGGGQVSVSSAPLQQPANGIGGDTSPAESALGGGSNNTNVSAALDQTVSAFDQDEVAIGANIARSIYGVDGTGLRIGIISSSFNYQGHEAQSQAAGLLPSGNNMVVLNDSNGDDEGRAMAELVHSVAPGAQIYFYSGNGGDAGIAAGVTTLAANGCNVIVDDAFYYDEPFFEPDDSISVAIQQAVASGVSYFTSAGNNGDDYYYSAWNGMPTAYNLPGVGVVPVQNVGNGTPYEKVLVNDNIILDLQWDQPFHGIGTYTGNTPYVMNVAVYDANFNFLYILQRSDDLYNLEDQYNSEDSTQPYNYGVIHNPTSNPTLYLAFYVSSGTGVPGVFKAIFVNDDDDAFTGIGSSVGSGGNFGHETDSTANIVGAVDFENTPAFGVATPANELFSDDGGSQYLFDGNGNRLATPLASPGPTFSAPDGGATDVSFDYIFGNDFFGTSAAAPNAAAVALLMLQADPTLSPAQITHILAQTAIATSTPQQGGAGLIQADVAVAAVALAHAAATTPIWAPTGGSSQWNLAANWSDLSLPTVSQTVTLSDGLGLFSSNYTVVYTNVRSATGGLVVNGGSGGAVPLLAIGAGAELDTGSVTIGTGGIDVLGTLAVSGTLSANGIAAVQQVIIETGGVVEIGTGTAVSIVFGGAGSVILDASTSTLLTTGFVGPIIGFSATDTLDLSGLAFDPTDQIVTTGASTVIETKAGTILANLRLVGAFSSLHLASDNRSGTPGTLIIAPPPSQPPVTGVPLIDAPAALTVGYRATTPIGNIAVWEAAPTTGDDVTLTVSDTDGTLDATGAGVTGSDSDDLEITGSINQVDAALATLTVQDIADGSDSLVLALTNSAGDTVTQQIAVNLSGVVVNNGTAGTAGTAGKSGTAGQSISATTDSLAASLTPVYAEKAIALGGVGGAGGNGISAAINPKTLQYTGRGGDAGAGGAGGHATATAMISIASVSENGYVLAKALGGRGGNSGGPGLGNPGGKASLGGPGGAATSSASATNTAGSVNSVAFAQGGDGGDASGFGGRAGGGGIASGSTASAFSTTASLLLDQVGGNGGNGTQGASGGSGGAGTAVNGLTAVTNNGPLSFDDEAFGGNGGNSDTAAGGSGGAAAVSLTFDDTMNPTQSAYIVSHASAYGGDAGSGAVSSAQGGTASVSGNIVDTADLISRWAAYGGTGGSGVSGVGGAASGIVAGKNSGTVSVEADVVGGDGGAATTGNGAPGGGATRTSATATGYDASAQANGTGGTGGNASGASAKAGAGGSATFTSATATGGNTAEAGVDQTGGAGGTGSNGASGGSGAASSLINAASAAAGAPVLTQIAQGGAGGASDTGKAGAGGQALSTLIFDSTHNSGFSPSATIGATGGAGGTSGGTGGDGGNAVSFGSISGATTGTGTVALQTTAQGGAAGGIGSRAGDATATAYATGSAVVITASADAGLGVTIAGTALALANAWGTSGSIDASGQTALAPSALVTGASANAKASVGGASSTIAAAAIGPISGFPVSGEGAVALIGALPSAANLPSSLAIAPNFTAVLGSKPVYLADGELGGSHSATGNLTQVSNATTDITVNTLLLGSTPDLMLAVSRIADSPTGITDITFGVLANGVSLLSQDFSTEAAAKSWFSNHSIDLGSIPSAAAVDIQLSMSVTTTSPGGSFDAGFLVAERNPLAIVHIL